MGTTSEIVASRFSVSKREQDAFALLSHQKASNARRQGLYNDEIVAVPTKDGNLISNDDGIREETTLASLEKLKPAFKEGGCTTAGNSSQVSDGAALVLLARRSEAERLGLPIIARFIDYAVVGCPPDIMGIGPSLAIPLVLKKCKLSMDDIDIFEINEAFASQSVYCAKNLKIDPRKLNPKGGAIALGHPLGCTGARQIATLLPELRRTGGRYGVVSMCIGTGMGAAAVIENLL